MSAKITYNDFVKEIQGGQTLTLYCKDEKMEHDLVIEAFGAGGSSVPEWDGSVTVLKSMYEISSGWLCEAQQGNYFIDGELTMGGTTVTITQLLLGVYSPASGTPTYQENWISVMVGDTFQTFDNTNAFTLKITGGDDIGNPDLASWLQSDGKLQ